MYISAIFCTACLKTAYISMLTFSRTQKEQCYIKSKAHLEQHWFHKDQTYMGTHKQNMNAIHIYFPASTSQSLRLKFNIPTTRAK